MYPSVFPDFQYHNSIFQLLDYYPGFWPNNIVKYLKHLTISTSYVLFISLDINIFFMLWSIILATSITFHFLFHFSCYVFSFDSFCKVWIAWAWHQSNIFSQPMNLTLSVPTMMHHASLSSSIFKNLKIWHNISTSPQSMFLVKHRQKQVSAIQIHPGKLIDSYFCHLPFYHSYPGCSGRSYLPLSWMDQFYGRIECLLFCILNLLILTSSSISVI